MTRRQPQARSSSRTVWPPRVLNRLSEAGASAYVWYESELIKHIDPNSRWSKWSDRISAAGLLLVVVVTAFGMGTRAMWVGFMAAAVLTVSMLMSRGNRIHSIPAFGLSVFFGWNPFVVAALCVQMIYRRWLPPNQAAALPVASMVLVAVGLAGHPEPWRFWGVAALLLVTPLLVAQITTEGGLRELVRRPGTISLPINYLPRPATRIPWLFTAPLPMAGELKRHRDEGVALIKTLEEGDPSKGSKRFDLSALNHQERDIAKKRTGGLAERKTGLILLGLKRTRGARFVHDVDLPGADRANIDHVAVTRAGVFVIDTKNFGSPSDPGTVRLQGGRLTHERKDGSHNLDQSISTLEWACTATRELIGHPTVTGVMVVHNAAVEAGIALHRQDGVTIYVICAEKLLSLLEDGGPEKPSVVDENGKPKGTWSRLGGWTRWMMACAGNQWQRWRHFYPNLRKFRSSTNGGAPVVLSPLGLNVQPRIRWSRPDETPSVADGRQPRQPIPKPAEPSPPIAPDPLPPVDPVAQMTEAVDSRWEEMMVSEPAAPDDVGPDLRGVRRGTPITVVEFADDDFTWHDMVAMSGPCHASQDDPPFVWACTPEQFEHFTKTGMRVTVVTVPLPKIMVGSDGGASV